MIRVVRWSRRERFYRRAIAYAQAHGAEAGSRPEGNGVVVRSGERSMSFSMGVYRRWFEVEMMAKIDSFLAKR